MEILWLPELCPDYEQIRSRRQAADQSTQALSTTTSNQSVTFAVESLSTNPYNPASGIRRPIAGIHDRFYPWPALAERIRDRTGPWPDQGRGLSPGNRQLPCG